MNYFSCNGGFLCARLVELLLLDGVSKLIMRGMVLEERFADATTCMEINWFITQLLGSHCSSRDWGREFLASPSICIDMK